MDFNRTGEKSIHANVGAEVFFTKVGITQDPIEQKIDIMHRLKVIEYYKDKSGKEKERIKEFLTYNVALDGLDWLGNPIKGRLEYEGRCEEPLKRIHKKQDENGSIKAEFRMHGTRHRYYIPFSKKAVDDLLEKTGTEKSTVKYYGKFANGHNSVTEVFRNGSFTYEQFVNTDFEDFEELARRQGGPDGKVKWIPEDKRKYIG